jgi:hypothetical protein
VVLSVEMAVVWIVDRDCVVLADGIGVWLMITVVGLDD